MRLPTVDHTRNVPLHILVSPCLDAPDSWRAVLCTPTGEVVATVGQDLPNMRSAFLAAERASSLAPFPIKIQPTPKQYAMVEEGKIPWIALPSADHFLVDYLRSKGEKVDAMP